MAGETSLDWKRFLSETMDKRFAAQEDRICIAFDRLKKANSNTMSISDLTEIFGGEAMAKEIMQEVDTDGDNTISFDEFCNDIAADVKKD